MKKTATKVAKKTKSVTKLPSRTRAVRGAKKQDEARMLEAFVCAIAGEECDENAPLDKDDLYYEAMDALSVDDYKSAEKMLLEARAMDPEYVQTYIGLTSVYRRPKDEKKAIENTKLAFEKTRREYPKWPKRMEWGFLENRAYLRAIHYRADIYLDEGEQANAIELYRLLLTLNPNDNQGIRYLLAGVYAGLSGEDVNKMFDAGNAQQNWSALEELVETQNKKHAFWKAPKGY